MASKDPTRSLKLSQVDTYISSVPIRSIWAGGSRRFADQVAKSTGQLVPNVGSIGMRVVSTDYFFSGSRALCRGAVCILPLSHIWSSCWLAWSANAGRSAARGFTCNTTAMLDMGQQKDLSQFAGETWLEATDWPASVRQASHAGPKWPEFHLDRKCGSARDSM